MYTAWLQGRKLYRRLLCLMARRSWIGSDRYVLSIAPTYEKHGLVKAVPLAPVAKDLRQLFIRQDGNPREILIDRLPALCGSKPTEACARSIIYNIESELGQYVQNIMYTFLQAPQSLLTSSFRDSLVIPTALSMCRHLNTMQSCVQYMP